MKNVFSVKLYLEGLKKIKLLGVAASIVVIVANALFPILTLLSLRSWNDRPSEIEVKSLLEHIPLGFFMMGFAILFVHAMFSYLNDRCRSDFYHALPQKRVCVFVSFGAAILSWMFGILVVSSLLNFILWMVIPDITVSFGVVIAAPLIYFAAAFLVAGFMAVAMTLTGTDMNNYLIFLLIFLIVRITGGTFLSCAEEMIPTFFVGASAFRFLKWEYFLPVTILFSMFENDISLLTSAGVIVYGVVLGVLLWIVAAWLYSIRRSEMAGKSAPNRFLQHVYRCAVSLPFFMWSLYWIEDESVSTAIVFFVMALVVYFLYELLTTKKLKNLVGAIPVLLVPLVCCGIFVGSIALMGKAYDSVRPTPEEIESVAICSDYNAYTYGSSTRANFGSEIWVKNEELARMVSENLVKTIDRDFSENEYVSHENFAIRKTDGKVIYRRIDFSYEDLTTMWDIYRHCDEYIEEMVKIPQENTVQGIFLPLPKDLTDAEAKELYHTFFKEYNSLPAATKADLLNNGYYEPVWKMYVYGTVNLQEYDATFFISREYLPVTYDAITSLYFEKQTTKPFAEFCQYFADNPDALKKYCESANFGVSVVKGEYWYLNLDMGRDKTFPEKLERLSALLPKEGEGTGEMILMINGFYNEETTYADPHVPVYFNFDFLIRMTEEECRSIFEKEEILTEE